MLTGLLEVDLESHTVSFKLLLLQVSNMLPDVSITSESSHPFVESASSPLEYLIALLASPASKFVSLDSCEVIFWIRQ